MNSNIVAMGAAVLYFSAKSRQPGAKLEIARTQYNSKQEPDEHLPTEEIRRVKQLCDEGSKYGRLYNPDLAKPDRHKLESAFQNYLAGCRSDTLRLEGGPREILGVEHHSL